MTNLEKLQKIASFRIDMSVDVKFDNGDIEHHEYETIRDLYPNWFVEIEHALKELEELKTQFAVNSIKDFLEHLEIIKNFIWEENGKLFVGVQCDIERELTKDDFDNDEEYELLKEIVK